jgi:hypothetical protein
MAKRSAFVLPSREPWSEADARRVLAAWRASGSSLWGFARQHGLHGQRLAYWRKRLSGGSSGQALVPMASLVPAVLVVEPERLAPESTPAVLRLPSGVVLELPRATPGWVSALVAELTRPA